MVSMIGGSYEAEEFTKNLGSPTVVGREVYGNLYGCEPQKLRSLETLEDIVRGAAEKGKMRILDIKKWKIGDGVSIIAIILESHIAVHTWPEYNFATVDVYSCGAHTEPRSAFEYIVNALGAEKYTINEADRSSEF
ncbi:adenosylmethionine decarboxylase [Sulfolobales archaeon HS-7]|nr:adenosylmethionine decarboxylase [Sulfolobales archaeon HS-7]